MLKFLVRVQFERDKSNYAFNLGKILSDVSVASYSVPMVRPYWT